MMPARMAATVEPPDASTAVAPNCAAPANTNADIPIAAPAPMIGCATTPNEIPTRTAATPNGMPTRMPSRSVFGFSSTRLGCRAIAANDHQPDQARDHHRDIADAGELL